MRNVNECKREGGGKLLIPKIFSGKKSSKLLWKAALYLYMYQEMGQTSQNIYL